MTEVKSRMFVRALLALSVLAVAVVGDAHLATAGSSTPVPPITVVDTRECVPSGQAIPSGRILYPSTICAVRLPNGQVVGGTSISGPDPGPLPQYHLTQVGPNAYNVSTTP